MAIFNNQDPQRESNVGQFGATDESIGAYKQAAEYAKDAEYWAKISQQGIKSIEDLLVVVQDLYEKSELQLEDIEQLKRDFAAQDARLMQLISQTNAVIKDANDTIDDMDAKLAEVQAQLDILLAMDVAVTTLPPGSDATGDYNPDTGLISLGIPEGQPGKDGSVKDLSTAPLGVPDSSDWGFYVESTDNTVFRAKMSDIAKTFPAVQSISYNGGAQKETGDVNVTKAKLGLGNVLNIPSYSKTETDNLNLPYPDVWAPLSDDTRLLAGIAPYDKLFISGQTLELPTKSMTFTRSTVATYIDKSGILKTAAINEPRFEKEGILIEGQSTNYFLNSDDPTKWNTSAAVTKTAITADGTSQAVTMKGVMNTEQNFPTFTVSSDLSLDVGDMVSISCRAKGSYGYIRVVLQMGANTQYAMAVNAVTGESLSPPAGATLVASLGSDGYISISATMPAKVAGVHTSRIMAQPATGDTVIPVGSEYYVQMPQLEKNVVPTSYIPTGSASVTRSGDNLEINPLGNVGYRLVGDSFTRSLAFEVSINKFNPTVNYVDLLANWGAKNDIILRCTPNTVRSYRSSTGPTISNVTIPFNSKLYAQTINTFNSNEVTSYFDGQSNTTTSGGPVDASTAGTALRFSGNSNAVFHIRNFRIWHRLLTPDQIRGIK